MYFVKSAEAGFRRRDPRGCLRVYSYMAKGVTHRTLPVSATPEISFWGNSRAKDLGYPSPPNLGPVRRRLCKTSQLQVRGKVTFRRPRKRTAAGMVSSRGTAPGLNCHCLFSALAEARLVAMG